MTTEDSDDPEKECVFPFTHDNITYFSCPFDSIDETKRWCSTKTDENGHFPPLTTTARANVINSALYIPAT